MKSVKSKDTIEQIDDCIKWLDKNSKSTNIVEIAQVIDRLAVLSVSLGHMVSEAYALQNELEDFYKVGYARHITLSTVSVAKAENEAEVAMGEAKREWSTAKNGYKRLSTYLDRVDKVIESYRQYISVTKLDLKNN